MTSMLVLLFAAALAACPKHAPEAIVAEAYADRTTEVPQ